MSKVFYRSTTLSTSHYAGRWEIPAEDQRNDLQVVNQLGYDYACAGDSVGKEALLLTALEAFHGYLSKYLVMILRGTIPPQNSYAGRDAHEFYACWRSKKTANQLIPRWGLKLRARCCIWLSKACRLKTSTIL